MTPLDVLDAAAVVGIASLCGRALVDAPTPDELAGSLFAPDQPAVVRGDPEVGVVATVEGDGRGYVRLLAVDPAHRGRGHGHALLRAAEDDLRARGLASVTVGADAPYHLFPGIETTETAMLCLVERHHYLRAEANFNMDVDLDTIPPDPGGADPATAADAEEIDAFLRTHWANWRAEAWRAFGKGTLVVARDRQGISAFCAYDVNRRGLLGPVAVRPDLIGKGAGAAPLLCALHRMRAAGRRRVEVAWVGPIVPYARIGGRIGRVFFVYRKELR